MSITDTEMVDNLQKLKALSDTTRLHIIGLLATEPLCACDLLEYFKITQPTLSYHMNLLTESKLIGSERLGKWTHYSLNMGEYGTLLEFLSRISMPGSEPAIKHCTDCGDRVEKTR
ncbi:MAG: ArsR/SmtB family transcription factor [Sphaerochaetaceae bacterium]